MTARGRTQPPKGGGGTGVDTIDKDDSYDDDDDNVASVGRQKTGRGPNDPADQASNARSETRSPKVPTRSGCSATVGTADDNVSSGGVLPIAREDEFASKERGHVLDFQLRTYVRTYRSHIGNS